MARLDGLRKRAEFTFYDTLLSPEGASTVEAEERLFTANKERPDYITNVGPQGYLSSDQSFSIERIRMAVFFEEWFVDQAPFGHIQMGTVVEPVLNGERLRPVQLLHLVDEERKNIPWPCVEFAYRTGPLYLAPRMAFYLLIRFSSSTVKLINETKGKKFFRFFLDGTLVRDRG